MTQQDWQTGNLRYLSKAVAWVRRLLEEHVGVQEPENLPEPAPEAASPAEEPEKKKAKGGKRKAASAQTGRAAAAPGTAARLAEEMAEAEADSGKPPAFIFLASTLELSPLEKNILLLCFAMEWDAGIGNLCARINGDPLRPFPTFDLAFTVFGEQHWEVLSPEAALRAWRLIEIHQPGALPLISSPLRIDERIANFVKGLTYLDDRLAALLTHFDPASVADLPASQKDMVVEIASRVNQWNIAEREPVVQLLGTDSISKEMVAAAAASELKLALCRLAASQVPAQPAELETFIRLWRRERLLLPLALYVEGVPPDAEGVQSGVGTSLERLLTRAGGLIFVDTRDVLPQLGQSDIRVDVAKPTSAEQAEMWAEALGKQRGDIALRLAGQFNLNGQAIRQIAAQIKAGADKSSLHERLWTACVTSSRPRLDLLAQRVNTRAGWTDIALPAREMGLLRQIVAQVAQKARVHHEWGFANKMGRGSALTALFSGDSGTGKTTAAEVLATELKLNLYRIDLSAVVSKYIGETEKNLRRLFDAAEDGGAILFFDEADALFGKRSEVKDSHDRYANIEVNYLLQRMEAYGGLAILATNRQSALDSAFLRRLRFVVNFPFPDATRRKAIWERVFPKDTPREALDLERLARLNLTGGNIASIALNAAFQAAQNDTKVSTDLLLDMARYEILKHGRPINELEFRLAARKGKVA